MDGCYCLLFFFRYSAANHPVNRDYQQSVIACTIFSSSSLQCLFVHHPSSKRLRITSLHIPRSYPLPFYPYHDHLIKTTPIAEQKNAITVFPHSHTYPTNKHAVKSHTDSTQHGANSPLTFLHPLHLTKYTITHTNPISLSSKTIHSPHNSTYNSNPPPFPPTHLPIHSPFPSTIRINENHTHPKSAPLLPSPLLHSENTP